MLMEQLKGIMQNYHLNAIYSAGFMDLEEDGLAEFVTLTSCLFLEFGQAWVKLETVEQYSKVALTIVDSIHITVDLEDVIPAKSRVSNFIFANPLIDNWVSEIVLYNMEKHAGEILCDALKIILRNKQELFIDPSFLGINIGGSEVEQLWKCGLAADSMPVPTVIKLNKSKRV